MGSDDHYPEEAPAHTAQVDGFWMDKTPVTNAQFQRFIAATDYVTLAERIPNAADYPGAQAELLVAGSTVFTSPGRPVNRNNYYNWWQWAPGADWRHPSGPQSSLKDRDQHPVVHVAWEDVAAYAHWIGKEIATEAEWEFAARGGLEGAEFAWGDELTPGGRHMAEYVQGDFPYRNLMQDGFAGTSPVGVFPANGYGVYDLIGNVWEWTTDWYAAHHAPSMACCTVANPTRRRPGTELRPTAARHSYPAEGNQRRVTPLRAQLLPALPPSGAYAQTVDTSTSHIGFRCIVRRLPGRAN